MTSTEVGGIVTGALVAGGVIVKFLDRFKSSSKNGKSGFVTFDKHETICDKNTKHIIDNFDLKLENASLKIVGDVVKEVKELIKK